MARKRHLIVIPALNEEKTIGTVIRNAKEYAPYADILLINDGSTDNTAAIARQEGVRVIDLPFNLGYGAALQTGFRFAERHGYDFVITMDADGQHVLSSVENLLAAMEHEAADVVIGSRFLKEGYRPGIPRAIGIWLFSKIAKMYTGATITDPTSGFQLLNRKAFSYLSQGDNYPLDYPDVNIIMALHRKKFRVVEAPVIMVKSPDKKSMHSGLRPVLYVIKMTLAVIMVMMGRERE
ncbi:MAG TPA: glycosyltransferase family 2 protein [Thermodesulfovibrionales bacterium]|nr:glycosyltransferase family 2 protein [Thermodesulfovibrionales bacterium]